MRRRLENKYQCRHIMGETPKLYGIYSFGRAADLKHNIVSVTDETGALVVEHLW